MSKKQQQHLGTPLHPNGRMIFITQRSGMQESCQKYNLRAHFVSRIKGGNLRTSWLHNLRILARVLNRRSEQQRVASSSMQEAILAGLLKSRRNWNLRVTRDSRNSCRCLFPRLRSRLKAYMKIQQRTKQRRSLFTCLFPSDYFSILDIEREKPFSCLFWKWFVALSPSWPLVVPFPALVHTCSGSLGLVP